MRHDPPAGSEAASKALSVGHSGSSGAGSGDAGPNFDVFAPEKRSEVMRRVKSRDTGPERKVRALLTSLGARYRLHRRDLPGTPDLVLGRIRLAVFVNGCFWHGHACRRGGRAPKTRAEYWSAKILRNRERDQEAARALEALGWRVEVVWECELADPEALGRRLSAVMGPLPAERRSAGAILSVRSTRTRPSRGASPRGPRPR